MSDPDAITTLPAAGGSDAAASAVHGDCANCGTPLLGPHCYRCGQPVKGLVRHFTSIIGDFLDSVFDLDTRIFQTAWPLLGRPGFLSNEYFAGRRVRYVSPVRLFVFLTIVTFFVAQFTFDIGNDDVQFEGGDAIAMATTVAEVEKVRDETLSELTEAREAIPASTPGARAGVDAGIAVVKARAAERIAELEGSQGKGAAATENDRKPRISFSNGDWHPTDNPVAVGWLPDFANRWINEQIGRGQSNVARLRKDPNLFKDAVLSALPSTLFVLLPIFALMLKVAYFFKRRLYMEHLIVALHSHAFLSLALLLLLGLTALGNALPAAAGVIDLLEVALFVWMPIYLLLMQKRVYGQGWLMTLLKYSVLGMSYVMLLSLGVAFTMLASLVWM